MAGWCVVREAMGPVSDFVGNDTWLSGNLTSSLNKSSAINGSLVSPSMTVLNDTKACSTHKCRYGLLNDMQVSWRFMKNFIQHNSFSETSRKENLAKS